MHFSIISGIMVTSRHMRDQDWHPGTRASRRSPCSALVLPAFSMAGGAAALRGTDLGSGMPTLHHLPPSTRWRPIEDCHMQTPKCDLTAEQVRELFNYDPEIGVLYWKHPGKSRRKSGIAGTKSKDGYITTTIHYVPYQNHRLIWLYVHGEWPKHVIDHINGITYDNRIENLRDVTPRINAENQRLPQPNNRSGILGATWIEKRKSYHVCIKVKGTPIFLGLFKDPDKARDAYITAKRKLHEGNTL